MPDLVGMVNEQKINVLELCKRLEPKYGKAEFGEPVSAEEMEKWENVNSIKIPEDYKAWLLFSGTSTFKGIEMELYPPEKFKVKCDYVIIGKRENEAIAFIDWNGRYIAADSKNKTRNLGYMETILRCWCYDVKELFAAEELEALRPIIEEQTAKMLAAKERANEPDAGVKEALEYFFARNNIAYLKKFRSFPICPFNDNMDSQMIISEPDMDGYCQWQPVLQNKTVDFESIENELGFKLHNDIKNLVSSYWYFSLEGRIKRIKFHIYAVTPDMDMKEVIIERFCKEDYSGGYKFVEKEKFFLMGSCCINGDDSFLIEVNNATGEVYAVQYMDRKNVKIAKSVYDLLMNGKTVWE